MKADNGAPGQRGQPAPFRTTLLKVLLVQAVALLLLWFLQATYHG